MRHWTQWFARTRVPSWPSAPRAAGHQGRLSARAARGGTTTDLSVSPLIRAKTSRPAFRALAGGVQDAPSSSSSGFSGFGLSDALVGRLSALDLETPTPIQREALAALGEPASSDHIGGGGEEEEEEDESGRAYAIEAYTGSGKTLAYLLPIVNELLLARDQGESGRAGGGKRKRGIFALVVVPSQELAMQICRVAQTLVGDEHAKLVQQCIGGANKRRQIAAIKSNSPQILVGTPGRLADLSKAGVLHTHFAKFLVLDEADKLLQENYLVDLAMIQQHAGKKKGSDHVRILCSATLPPSTARVFKERGWIGRHRYRHLTMSGKAEPGRDKVDGTQAKAAVPELSPNLDHCFVPAPKIRKVDTVRRCINALQPSKVLVFHNFSNQLAQTAARLQTGEITVGVLDGKMKKEAKRKVIQAFGRGEIRALVASEAATRGLDFPGCDCVVNMDMPMDAGHYVHRAGRTGRGAAKGVVISVPSGKEVIAISKFSRFLGIDIPEYTVTHGEIRPL